MLYYNKPRSSHIDFFRDGNGLSPCPGHGCLDIEATGSPDFAAPDTAGVGPGEK